MLNALLFSVCQFAGVKRCLALAGMVALPFFAAAQCNNLIDFCLTTPSSCQGADGTATPVLTIIPGVNSFVWTDAQGNFITTDSIATGLSAGTYQVVATNVAAPSLVTVYQESFNGAGAAVWTLNTPTGPNGADNNFWEVDDDEGGVAVGSCGVANNGDNTLHITSAFNPNGGAAYDAGGLCGILFCPETNMRAESGDISTLGFTNLTLSFDFIANGDALLDNASLLYSTDGGASFQTLDPSFKSATCPPFGQGEWTLGTYALPPACENIPNLRIAFNWTNNDDGAGSDPSVAINNVLIEAATPGAVCIDTQLVIINSTGPFIQDSLIINSVCGSPNGSVLIFPTNGTPPYNYSWTTLANPGNVFDTDSLITGLVPGFYVVTLTNADGSCPFIDTFEVTDGAGTPPIIQNTAVQDASCLNNDGTAAVLAVGGLQPFIFAWVDVATGNVVSNTFIANGLPTGTYVYTVINNDGTCPQSDTVVVGNTNNQPFIGAAFPIGTACDVDTGSVAVTVTGGDAPYLFTWENQLAPGQVISSDSLVLGLSAGTFNVTVTNADGNCPDTLLGIDVISTNGAVITGFTGIVPSDCYTPTGSATVQVFGGVPPYTYLWSNGDTSATASNLTSGTYSVTISDASGNADCIAAGSVFIPELPPYTMDSVAISPATCGARNGEIEVFVSGLPAFIYRWADTANVTLGNNSSLTGLYPDTYFLTITDGNGTCPLRDTFILPSLDAPTIVDTMVVNTLCGDTTGMASVVVSGGTAPYTYAWAGAANVNQIISTNDTLFNLAAGWYFVTVTNADTTCPVITAFIVAQADGPTITNLAATSIGCGGQNGTVDPTVVGGTPPLLYQWTAQSNPGAVLSTDSILTNITVADQYTVVVTNSDSTCPFAASAFVNDPPVITGFITQEAGCDPSRGTAAPLVTGGTLPYSFVWSPLDSPQVVLSTDSVAIGLAAGEYSVTVTDFYNACNIVGTVEIGTAELTPVYPFVFPSNCDPAGGSAYIQLFDGEAPFRYTWSDSNGVVVSIDSFANNLTPGAYSLTVRDTNLCTFTWDLVIEGSLAPEVQIGYQLDTLLLLGDTINIEAGDTAILVAQTDSSYILDWTPPVELSCLNCPTTFATPFENTTYYLTVTDSLGCTSTDTVLVIVTVGPQEVWVPSAFTPNGDNRNERIFVNGVGVEAIEYFRIYDRIGEKVFENIGGFANDPASGWDGFYKSRELSPGVYVYTLEVRFENQTRRSYKGQFTLIR